MSDMKSYISSNPTGPLLSQKGISKKKNLGGDNNAQWIKKKKLNTQINTPTCTFLKGKPLT